MKDRTKKTDRKTVAAQKNENKNRKGLRTGVKAGKIGWQPV
ncbi:hypothetical protein GCAAIG_04590 [Candidatus Electronema halotolerans]|jgi:hypothetical protein